MTATVALAIVSIIFGIISVILVSTWATNPSKDKDSCLGTPTSLMGYPGSVNVFPWHPSMFEILFIVIIFYYLL